MGEGPCATNKIFEQGQVNKTYNCIYSKVEGIY